MRGHRNEKVCYTRDRKGNLKYETSEMACDCLTFQHFSHAEIQECLKFVHVTRPIGLLIANFGTVVTDHRPCRTIRKGTVVSYLLSYRDGAYIITFFFVFRFLFQLTTYCKLRVLRRERTLLYIQY